MNTEFFNALDALEAERGISKAHMMEKIEAALTRAYQREKGGLENVRVVMDEAKKDIKVYQVKKIVAGPNVYICDECINLCHEIVLEE